MVRTPKNQAANCIKTQKAALLGYKASQKVKEQKVVQHNLFYWILDLEDEKEMSKITFKCARGEVMIKKFYSTLFKLLNRANRLATKFKKGAGWIRKWINKQLKKHGQADEGMQNHIDSMTDEQLIDFIKVTDRKDMDKLLSGNLIEITRIDSGKKDK